MSKQNDEDTDLTKSLGNLFEDEIGKSEDAPLFDCPHCDHPVTKSEVLAKARGGLPGSAKKTDKARAQNNASGEGANARYGNSPKPHVATKKSGKKVPKTSPAYPKTMAAKKSDNADDESVEDTTADDESTEDTTTEKPTMAKSTIRGTAHVQYVTDMSPSGDAAIAKMIAEGSLGQEPTQPIDKNHKRTW